MIKQFRNKSAKELHELVRSWKAELLALRFQQAVGQLEKPHKFRELRVSVARALTVLAEMAKNAPGEPNKEPKQPRILKIKALRTKKAATEKTKKEKAPAKQAKKEGGEG